VLPPPAFGPPAGSPVGVVVGRTVGLAGESVAGVVAGVTVGEAGVVVTVALVTGAGGVGADVGPDVWAKQNLSPSNSKSRIKTRSTIVRVRARRVAGRPGPDE
jgi:hypothetical protein